MPEHGRDLPIRRACMCQLNTAQMPQAVRRVGGREAEFARHPDGALSLQMLFIFFLLHVSPQYEAPSISPDIGKNTKLRLIQFGQSTKSLHKEIK